MSQCNARGEHYLKTKEEMLGRQLTTCERLLYTIEEHKKGTGPCYVDVSILSREQYKELVENYLNMAPSIVLGLLEEPERPQTHVEIYGSEPYINGGHGMAGFWINEHRHSTLEGLYAVGDVAGGAPKKYITGCFAEAEIAVEDILNTWPKPLNFDVDQASEQAAVREILAPLSSGGDITFQEAEERLQKIMEEYAGGSTQYYETSRDELLVARRYLKSFTKRAEDIKASDTHELMRAQDALDRILLARTLVEHLLARRETRWPCYQTRLDYPYRNDIEYKVFINSYMKDDEIVVLKRELQPPYQISALEGNEL
jgi:adenylylsulfate reductase subunit A